MTAPRDTLEHLGVMYADPESLVASVGPRVVDALAAGGDVFLSVDRRTARELRDWLGPAGDRAAFPAPTRWPHDLVRDLRSVVRPGRRTLVLGQYTATGLCADEQLDGEDGINLVLGDLPLTVMCGCAYDAAPAFLSPLRVGHPALLVDGEVVPNPDYRPPLPCRPVTGALWGPPTLRLEFSAPAELHRLREHVSRAAEAVGLRGETVREAVLAAHEAAMLAAGGLPPGPLDLDAPPTLDGADGYGLTVPCVLEVRADAGVLHCEIRGPRPEVRVDLDVDLLQIVRLFCDSALLHDEADVRSVRVLRAPHGARAA